MTRLALLALAGALAAGCGSDSASGGGDVALPPDPPAIPDAADLGDDFGDDLDELPPDTLAAGVPADSIDALAPAASGEAAPAPTFAPFLSEFKVALQNGTAARLALPAADLAALRDPDFQREILAAGPDRYRRDGTRREAYVVVGFDAEGNVVPEDEAMTESGLGLVFDVVDGRYRLVRVERAG